MPTMNASQSHSNYNMQKQSTTPYFQNQNDNSLDSIIDNIVKLSQNIKYASTSNETRPTNDQYNMSSSYQHTNNEVSFTPQPQHSHRQPPRQIAQSTQYEQENRAPATQQPQNINRQEYITKFERPRSHRSSSSHRSNVMKNVEISPMKFQPDFTHEKQNHTDPPQDQNSLYEEKARQRDELHRQNQHIHSKVDAQPH